MTNIYVGNLPRESSEQDLREHFETFGRVERVSIITDRDTGRSRGFGFVEMTDEAEAQAAINELNGKDFAGRPLTVNISRPKAESGGGRRSSGIHDGRERSW